MTNHGSGSRHPISSLHARGGLPEHAEAKGAAAWKGGGPRPHGIALRRWGLPSMAAALSVFAACGDEKSPPPQAVVFLGLTGTTEGSCLVLDSYGLPEGSDARGTATRGDGPTEDNRLVDGDDGARVECRVALAADGSGNFDVDFRLVNGPIRNFSGSGRLPAAEDASGELEVTLALSNATTPLEQDDCTAQVGRVLEGAIWISALTCPALADPRTEGLVCNGSGAVIFENCAR